MIRWLKALLVGLPAVACNTATRIDYRHVPTVDLHQQWDLSNAAYGPFKVDGVVISPFVKLATHDTTQVVLRLAGPEAVTVHVTSAELAGRDLAVDQAVPLDQAPKPGVHTGRLVLAELPNTELETLSGGHDMKLNLGLRVGEGTGSTLSFDITRRETTQMVTH